MNADNFMTWLQTETVAGMSLMSLCLAIGVAVLAYVAMRTALRLALGRLKTMADRTSTRIDDTAVDVLSGTSQGLMLLVALLMGVGMLELPDRWHARVGQLWFVALVLQVGLWGTRAIAVGVRRYIERHSSGGMTQVGASATLMSWGLRTLLWAVVLLAMLSNLGVNITAFVASLGVGGIAVALAVQNILGDLFASLAIAVDKPFEVGDFIVVGGIAGTVQLVGLKTTRIRSLSGEQVVMSNTELLKQTINNFKRMAERRIVFQFGVTYDTTPEQAQAIPALVRRAVEASGKTRFDRAHLKGFGDSSLDYEVVYIVLDPSYNLYMDLQQEINLTLMRELDAMGVGFAFPTRTLHFAPREAAPAAA